MSDSPPRHSYIGSSDAAAIIGLSGYRTSHQVWEQKVLGLSGKPAPEGGVLERGIFLEPAILDAFERETGLVVQGRQEFVQLLHKPYIGGHIDGRAQDGGLVEAKSVAMGKEDDWGSPDTSEIAEEYYPQVQHLMGITGAEFCWVPVAFVGEYKIKFATYCVPRDHVFIQDLFAAEDRFWDCVQRETPPLVLQASDVQRRWPKDNGLILDCDENVSSDVALLKAVKAREKLVREEIKGIEDRLKLAIGDASGLRYGGKVICSYKQQQRAGYTVQPTSFRVLRTYDK